MNLAEIHKSAKKLRLCLLHKFPVKHLGALLIYPAQKI